MSAKMKRRRRHDRLKRIATEQRNRREAALFFERGTIPAHARSFARCACGAEAFSFAAGDYLDDFRDAHAYCHDDYL